MALISQIAYTPHHARPCHAWLHSMSRLCMFLRMPDRNMRLQQHMAVPRSLSPPRPDPTAPPAAAAAARAGSACHGACGRRPARAVSLCAGRLYGGVCCAPWMAPAAVSVELRTRNCKKSLGGKTKRRAGGRARGGGGGGGGGYQRCARINPVAGRSNRLQRPALLVKTVAVVVAAAAAARQQKDRTAPADVAATTAGSAAVSA